ncbi:four helix bundle protein [Geoalkalibacter halelectricus]|uniref:Four helix bundle protein n=1 Tax=Geoalkalibacter halelectricus TaxID=2847045 RepID=A0ABY5ZGY1_9BACT|nr:four helix bundle protein [Geoalkalibacter halelectricus]MDO3377865.1 four helix bundle protein [Geoalkalibacter halelectricus]UWZ77951.1 four helix bundle protein [Geoalkalibacter halelectricus]
MRFEDLEVWKRSARLSADIYKELGELKDYGFKDQITRSGLSVPSNIAEGLERVSRAECVKFLLYSKGSCGELRTQIYIGMDIAYIDKELGKKWIRETEAISSMLGGLIRAKKNRNP